VTEHINFLLLGVGNGAVYAALAMALVVTYRSSGVLNFATGALALHAAYTYAYLRQGLLLNPIPPFTPTIDLGGKLSFFPAMLIAVAIEALVGVLLYLAVFRLMRNAVPVAKAVASLGVTVVLTALLAEQAGTSQTLVDPIFKAHTYTIGGVRIIGDRLWFAVAIIGVALVLGAVYKFTPFGLATRAASETEVGALVSGVSPERIAVINWAISAAVCALAGVLIAPLVSLIPGTYTLFIVPALAVAVLGRFTSLTAAVAGGLALGMLGSEAVFLKGDYAWLPKSGVPELIPLILVLVVLVARGKPLPTRGTLVQQTLGRAPRPHRLAPPLVVATSVALIALFTMKGSIRAALIYTFIVAVISLSLVVVTGYAGQISLAQLTLAGVAGFLLSGMTTSWSVPFPIAPILAALGAMAIGVVVGLPALRIRGLLVGIVTLTLAVCLEALWFRNPDFNGGAKGARVVPPKLFGLDLGIGAGQNYPRPAFGVLCLVVLVLVALGVAKLRTSRLGSAMLAVRANERSAAASGISVVRVKLMAFAIGAFIAGLGGALLAYQQQTITFQSFSALGGLNLFTTAYLAGITSVAGGILAGVIAGSGIFYVLLDRRVDIGDWFPIVTGVLLIFTVIKNPEGVVGPMHEQIARRRAKKAATRIPSPAGVTEPEPPAIRVGPRQLAAPTTPALLTVDSLSVKYGGVVAVDDVSFSVPDGLIVGLIGPNGAGKTTIMDALCGFTAYAGRVVLGTTELDGLAPHRRVRAGLGRTFQGIDLYEDLSVIENVVVGQFLKSRGRRIMSSHDYEGVNDALDELGLLSRRDDVVRDLSQGQRQLVSIARALVGEPRLLMLDEPAGGLDTTESAWLAERLRRVRDAGTTILLIDHDMSLVLALCDLIHVVDFGQLIASGPPDEIRTDPRVSEAYLGSTHAEPVSAQ
jgi:sulfate-transporting ATPase